MMALLIAGIGLIAMFCVVNSVLMQIDKALDAAFNGGCHE